MAIVGSHETPIILGIVAVTEVMERLPSDAVIHLRHPRNGDAASFESMVANIAVSEDRHIRWFTPGEGGRGAVFERDYEMVEASDAVLAFFPEGNIMSGGTGHVVDAALAREVPVTAWELGRNEFRLIGDWKPEL